ncbi:MAG: imidazole glycerol phosphate synthase subunit HisF [Labilithrix sp.]|nr:imidazole glycerol phosphate synthase subunit HisF [Labilithrix sp.]
MYRPRIIAVVLVDGTHAVKTVRFKRRIDLGDPVNTVSLFNAFRVDELVLLDIDATKSRRTIAFSLLADIASEAKMPFSVGGGIRTLEDIREVLSLGAEKVVLSTVAAQRPEFVREAAARFGSSSIIVCMDVKRSFFGSVGVWLASERRQLRRSPLEFARLMEEMGAGELIVQSVDNDGMMTGYDQPLLSEVSATLNIPVIALGGAGRLEHCLDVYAATHVSALASGSLFVFQNSERGVLINYPSREQLRRFVNVRAF